MSVSFADLFALATKAFKLDQEGSHFCDPIVVSLVNAESFLTADPVGNQIVLTPTGTDGSSVQLGTLEAQLMFSYLEYELLTPILATISPCNMKTLAFATASLTTNYAIGNGEVYLVIPDLK